MSSADLAVWIQTIVVVVSFGLAYRQFVRWQEEIVGGKQIDLAIEIGKAALHLREAFKAARNPIEFVPTTYTFLPGQDETERRNEWRYYDASQREELVSGPLQDLGRVLWEASILFDADLEQEFKLHYYSYLDLQATFRHAVFAHYGDTATPEQIRIRTWRAPSETDEFEKAVHDVTERLLASVRKVVPPRKSQQKYNVSAEWRAS